MLEARDDFEGAAKAFAAALALEPDAHVEAKLEIVRARAELARLPAEYRAIDGATQITRGDLAALIGVRLAGLLQIHSHARRRAHHRHPHPLGVFLDRHRRPAPA